MRKLNPIYIKSKWVLWRNNVIGNQSHNEKDDKPLFDLNDNRQNKKNSEKLLHQLFGDGNNNVCFIDILLLYKNVQKIMRKNVWFFKILLAYSSSLWVKFLIKLLAIILNYFFTNFSIPINRHQNQLLFTTIILGRKTWK